MGKNVVYIDGKEGTTGLQIYDRIAARSDIELLLIDEEKRKDINERRKLINAADVVFLCLPDEAAKEAAGLCENPETRIIDASTAHRTADGWTYGFPELSPRQRDAIAHSKRVANPGCHASGFISSAYPLVKNGMMPADCLLTCYSLTGYSGGGKKMIAEYESERRDPRLSSDRIYGLNLKHKHLPEMQKVCGLNHAPLFSPIVGDYYKGMATTLMLWRDMLRGGPSSEDIRAALAEHYRNEHFVSVAPFGGDESVILSSTNAGTNNLRLIVCGNGEQTTVTALFDNLGKGASGAAVQNMNIMLGLDEKTGLE
jgi:N-acetyl-gamma-glutamyl-phosphate reductase